MIRRHRAPGRVRERRGVTLVEILVASAVVTLLLVPILSMVSVSGHEAMISEDYILAQTVAQRHLHELLSVPWTELQSRLPLREEIAGVPAQDAGVARLCPEYATALTGRDAMRGELRASQIGEGLVSVSVTLRWPVRPGSAQQRSYSLLRFRQRPDLSVRISYRLGSIEPAVAPPDDDDGGDW